MGDPKETYGVACKWMGFISSAFCLLLFIFRLVQPSQGFGNFGITWQDDFLDDGNKGSWRETVFSFAPSVFVDVWTPFLFFWLGVMIHIKASPYRVEAVGKNWQIYFGFQFVQAMFAGLPYGGNMGIILGPIMLLTALMCLIAIFICDGDPKLDLEIKADLSAKNQTDAGEIYGKVCNWFGFIACLLVIVVGIFRLFTSGAKLVWDNDGNDFIRDNNKQPFRDPLFTFVPDEFIDAWQPTILGVIGAMYHFEGSPFVIKWFMENWLRFFLYHFITAMFGCIGYVGNLGIIFCPVPFLAALLMLVAFFICTDKPGLKLNITGKLSLKGGGANIET